MFNFSENPFIRLVIWLVAGILLEDIVPERIVPALLIGLAVLWFLLERYKRFNFVPGLLILVLGVFLAQKSNLKNIPYSIYNFKNTEVILYGKVEGEIKENEKFKAFVLNNLFLVDDDNSLHKLKGKIWVRAAKFNKTVLHNDEVIIRTHLTEFSPPVWEELFNYAKLMERKQIYLQAQADGSRIYLIPSTDFNLRRTAILFKQQIQHWFNLYLSADASGLAIALITGDDDRVDNPLIQAFKNTGTMHLLAVSGMHVGLIFLLLNAIFIRIKKKRWAQIFFDLVTLACVWMFCMIAGLSDSVIRAGTMLTFVIVGHILDKKANAINYLFASVFCMLVYNPNYLYNAGFQLSVCAVLGIFLFYQPIRKLLLVKNKWINRLIDLAALSLAAQIGTFVISIYYFNQFPNWFLLSNIVLVPFASVIIYGSLVLLIVSPFKWLAVKIGLWLSVVIKGFCKVLFLFNSFPFLVSFPVVISSLQVFVLLAFVLVTYFVISQKKFGLIKYQLALIVIFLISGIFHNYQLNLTGKYYFVSLSNKPIIIQQNGKDLFAFSNGKLAESLKRTITDYSIKNSTNLPKILDINCDTASTFFVVNNKSLVNERGIFSFNKKCFKSKNLSVVTAKSRKQKSYPVLAYYTANENNFSVNSPTALEIK